MKFFPFSLNHCCYGEARMLFFDIVADPKKKDTFYFIASANIVIPPYWIRTILWLTQAATHIFLLI